MQSVIGSPRAKKFASLSYGSGLLFAAGCGLFHLSEHVTNSLGCPRSAFFPPSFESFAMFFEVGKHVRVFEEFAPPANYRFQALPNNPLLAGILKEHFFVD